MNILLEVSPRKPSGEVTTIRMSSAAATKSHSTILDGHEWLPLIKKAPTTSVELLDDEGNLSDIAIRRGSIEFRLARVFKNEAWMNYIWSGAPTRILAGNFGDAFSDYVPIIQGTVSNIGHKDATATLEILGSDSLLDTELLSLTYAGTGEAEGPKELEGNLKPWCSGYAKNVLPILIDPAKWIYQVHGYGPIQDIQTVYARAEALSPRSAVVNTYAELAALPLMPGQWAACLPLGMFRIGGAPKYKITADVSGARNGAGFPTTIQQIVPHLLSLAGIPSEKIGSFSQFIGSTWNLYQTSQVTIGDVVRDAMRQAGGYLIADGEGKWHSGDFYAEKPATPLTSDRSTLPLVRPGTIEGFPAADPVWKVEYGYDRNWSKHSDNDISPALDDQINEATDLVNGVVTDIEGIREQLANVTGVDILPLIELVDGNAELSLRALSTGDKATRVLRADAFTRIHDYREEALANGGIQQSLIDGLGVRMGDSEAAMQEEITLRTDGDTANLNQINILVTRTGANEAAIVAEREARTTEDEAMVSKFDGLEASLGADITAGLEAEATARVTAISAEVNNRTNALATLSSNVIAAIQTEETARVDEDGALGQRIDQVSVKVDDADARITTEVTALVNADAALASEVTTVKATANGAAATASSALSASSQFGSRWTLALAANGHAQGIIAANGGSGYGSIGFVFDKFIVSNGIGTGVAPFMITGGQNYLSNTIVNGSLLVNGTLTAEKILGGAITTTSWNEQGGSFGIGPSASQNFAMGHPTTFAYAPHSISVNVTCGHTGSGGAGIIVRLLRNGSLLGQRSFLLQQSFQFTGSFTFFDQPPTTGTNTYSMTVQTTPGSDTAASHISSNMIVTEYKR